MTEEALVHLKEKDKKHETRISRLEKGFRKHSLLFTALVSPFVLFGKFIAAKFL